MEGHHPISTQVRLVEKDLDLIQVWLDSKSERTRKAYRNEISKLFSFLEGKPIKDIKMSDLQRYAQFLEDKGYAVDTRRWSLSIMKSFFSFANEVWYLPYNLGAVIKLPKKKDDLAERILTEEQIFAIINAYSPDDGGRHLRNHVLLRLLYHTGVRVSELVGLKWKDLREKDGKMVATIFGKGGKTRYVVISGKTCELLHCYKEEIDHGPEDPVFPSQKGGHLEAQSVWCLVKRASKKAGLDIKRISPHWFRHSHATHSIQRGASVHLVQQTLGHSTLAQTGKYLHANPDESSGRYLGV